MVLAQARVPVNGAQLVRLQGNRRMRVGRGRVELEGSTEVNGKHRKQSVGNVREIYED